MPILNSEDSDIRHTLGMIVLNPVTTRILCSHCYRSFTYCTNDPHGEQYKADWIHFCWDNWCPRTADAPLSSVHSHLPHHSGWELGGDHVDPAGPSSPHSHVLLPQSPLSGGLWLLHSCHSQSGGRIPHRRQGHFLQCIYCSVFLFYSLSHCGNTFLSLNGLWPSCSSM